MQLKEKTPKTQERLVAARELLRVLKKMVALADAMGWKAPTAAAAIRRAEQLGITAPDEED